jgi:hypothetical protein
LLVFGRAHDFKKRIESLNDPSIIFRSSIETCDSATVELHDAKPKSLFYGKDAIDDYGKEKKLTHPAFHQKDLVNTMSEKIEAVLNAETLHPLKVPNKKLTLSRPISSDLEEIIFNGGLSDFLNAKLVSLDQIEEYHKSKPWVLDAMRADNFIIAITNKIITIEQIAKLSKEEVYSLRWKEYGEALKLKVEEYIKRTSDKRLVCALPMMKPVTDAYGLVTNSLFYPQMRVALAAAKMCGNPQAQKLWDKEYGLIPFPKV